MIDRALEILAELVACDTQNPPRQIHADGEIFESIRRWLGDSFRFDCRDFGKGRLNLLAQRGQPRRLFNVHLDTVPVGNDWTKPSLQLSLDSDKVFGRGVCDIKGAAACLIAAASSIPGDVAILFSTDEEGADSCCIDEFCRSGLLDSFWNVIVAEPTGCQAVVGHRGYLSVSGCFSGQAAHTSQHQLLSNSGNHRAATWIVDALKSVSEFERVTLCGDSACFNVGRIDGGIKNNIIADRCDVSWSARLPAGFPNQKLLDQVMQVSAKNVRWQTTFDGDSLPGNPKQRMETQQLCQRWSLPIGDDVDFWTEAAIFAATGKPTLVLGPGDIRQAHTADEWVSRKQLETCVSVYRQLMEQDPSC